MAKTIKSGKLLFKSRGKERSITIPLPPKRFNFGIVKHREGYVDMGWFLTNPKINNNYGPGNFFMKRYQVPLDVDEVRLKIGGRVMQISS